MLCILIFFGSWFGGIQLRRENCKSICNAAEPLIAAVDAFYKEHGTYPSATEIDAQLSALSRNAGITFMRRSFLSSGSFDVADLNDADVTVYISSKECFWLVPIERPSIMSFTRFAVFMRSNESAGWTEDSMRWTFEKQ